jgi:hypothetical protein
VRSNGSPELKNKQKKAAKTIHLASRSIQITPNEGQD